MGLPQGFICDVPGISRNDMAKLAGNGVCPQQGELALRILLNMQEPPVVGGGAPGVPVGRLQQANSRPSPGG